MATNFELTPIPDTLTEAIDVIVKSLTDDEKAFIKAEYPELVHYSVGMPMRNGWKLWERGSARYKEHWKSMGMDPLDLEGKG